MFKPDSGKKIIIAPLDWGLGHATRCIPVIRYCIEKGHQIIIISTGRSLELLKREFPTLQFIDLPAYSIYYQRKGSFLLKIILQIGKIFKGIKKEHKALDKIVEEVQPDFIISDSRYGLWNKKIKSILITHQIMVKIPSLKFMEFFAHKWLLSHHNKFNEVWIPDVGGSNNLSGDLSHFYMLRSNTKFIGLLTRFRKPEISLPVVYDAVVIISGPEPQRTIFEDMIMLQAKNTSFKLIIIKGKSEMNTDESVTENIRAVSHLPAEELFRVILQSKLIISRGGYSTLMDLALLNKKCICIPTPGQTEQEYLVKELHHKKSVLYAEQNSFNLENAMKEVEKVNALFIDTSEHAFINTLELSLNSV